MKFIKKFFLVSSYVSFFIAALSHDTSCSAFTVTDLTNAVPVSLSLSTGEDQFYSIEIPSETTGLEVSLSGGTGDLDLYTRYGTPPDTGSYDCRPYLYGNNETCIRAVPADGTWYIMVRGYSAGSATLTATYVTGAIPATALSNGTPVSLSLSRNEEQLYSIEIPSETTGLEVSLSGGTGDLDLYTRYGTPPGTGSYDCRPYLYGNDETCTYAEPSDGTWYIMVQGYSAGSATLAATYATCSDGEKNGDEAGVDCGGSCPDACGDGSTFVDHQLSSPCFGAYSISDRDCSGSDGIAYSTITEAIQSIEDGAGGIIVIRGGIYAEEVTINRSGNQDAYLVIKAYPGETPIIDGGGSLPTTSYHDGLVSAAFRSYIHIQGLTIRNSRYMGFHAYHCDHIRVIDCTVHDVQDGGICFNTGTDILIDSCEVHHSNQEGPAAMHEAVTIRTVDTFEISNTVVHDCEEEGIDVKYHATNGSIHDCYLDNNILYIDKANNINLYNNILTNSGILLGIETGGDIPAPFETHHINIYNNLISESPYGVALWVEESGTFSDVLITNNLFYRNTNGIRSYASEDHYGADVIARNNIFWLSQEGAFTGNSDALTRILIDHNLFDNTDSTGHGSNAVTTADVMFVNETAKDFHLESGSPAGGSASSLGAPEADFDGTLRSVPHDIGPYVVP